MGSIARITRYVKDLWRVIVRGESDDLQRKTVSMQGELARLRNRRLTSDKEREAAALNQARGAVQRMRELHDSLLAAEKATAELAAKLGEAAKSSIEAHAGTREQAYKRFFAKQKELYEQEVDRELQGGMGPPLSELPIQCNGQDVASKAPSNGQDEASKAPEVKLSEPDNGGDNIAIAAKSEIMASEAVVVHGQEEASKAAEVKFSEPVDGGDNTGVAANSKIMASEAGEVQTCPAVLQGTIEEVGQPTISAVTDEALSSSSSASKAPEVKFSEPVDGGDNTGIAAKGEIMASEGGGVQTCPAVVQGTIEEVGLPTIRAVADEATPSSSSDQNMAGKEMDFTQQEIPEEVIAQMMQEVKRQVRCEEKSHLDALARDKAILETEIKARERERGSVSQGHQ